MVALLATALPSAMPPEIVLVGDSTTACGGQDRSEIHDPAHTVEALLARAPEGNRWRGARVHNEARSGSGTSQWLRTHVRRVKRKHPRIDAVIITLGINDFESDDPTATIERIREIAARFAPATIWITAPHEVDPKNRTIDEISPGLIDRYAAWNDRLTAAMRAEKLVDFEFPGFPKYDGLHHRGRSCILVGAWIAAQLTDPNR